MTEREWTTRALSASDGRFIASADSATSILVLARGRGRAAMFARALPSAIEGVMANPMPANPGPEIAAWPGPVRSVIAFLGAIHHDLRDSSLAEKDPLPVSLDVLLAVVAEGRLYLVAAGSVAAFLRREENWELLAPLSGKARLPLGVEPRARIEVTSEPLEPGDVLLAVPSPHGASEEPDPELVAALHAWAEGDSEDDVPSGGSFAAFACDAHVVLEAEDDAEHLELEPHDGDIDDEHVAIVEIEEEVAPPADLTEGGLPDWLMEPGAAGLEGLPALAGAPEPELIDPQTLAARARAKQRNRHLVLAGAGALAIAASFAIGMQLWEVWQVRTRARAAAAAPAAVETQPAAPAAGAIDTPATQSAMGGLMGKTAPWQRVVTGAATAQAAGGGDRGAGAAAAGSSRGPRADEAPAGAPATPAAPGTQGSSAGQMTSRTPPSPHVATSGFPGGKTAPPPLGGRGVEAVTGGRIEARTEPYREAVAVFVDGKPIGVAPVGIGGIPPGRHVVRFETTDGLFWEEEVTLVGNELATAIAPFGAEPSRGVVEVIASVMSDEGAIEEEDVLVFVDGKARGTTPVELTLDPGTYGVRIEPDTGGSIHRVVQVRQGDRQVLEFRLDQPPPFAIEHKPATSLTHESTPILTAVVRGQGVQMVRIDLHVMEADGWTTIPMGQVPGAPGTFAAGLPVDQALHGKTLRYFMSTAEGEAKVETAIFAVPIR